MIVGVSTIEIFLPDSQSLKDKRQAVKKIIEKTRMRFNISIADFSQNNLWQRVKIGFSVVGINKDHIDAAIEDINNYIESLYIGKIIDTNSEIIILGNEI
ncbi:MAG: DUF503 domain-containing protein [Syntrophorhabdaceae bacterium]|nr:DUF503 domain-containing protein [Syntrophorhabdales bacterium]MBP9560843.1 DUF503 domain-containing protein [Syntrophorhabdaceae bacterium]